MASRIFPRRIRAAATVPVPKFLSSLNFCRIENKSVQIKYFVLNLHNDNSSPH